MKDTLDIRNPKYWVMTRRLDERNLQFRISAGPQVFAVILGVPDIVKLRYAQFGVVYVN